MTISAKYVHTNLVARDWKTLADFYQTVFGCSPVPPERNLTGPAIANATNISNAHIRGMHMRLPGWGDEGPTLEIFSYIPDVPYYEIGKDLLPDVVKRGEKFYAYECNDYSKGIDTREKWDEVEDYLKKNNITFAKN